ncbi:MAG: fibrobacter succinogenes major paralogous domain-containing protein [bacterium]|nr:fibrobacter succinogenes major paralogous domain-containing protein [bacterium]
MKQLPFILICFASIVLFSCSTGEDDANGEKNEQKEKSPNNSFSTVEIAGFKITDKNYDGLTYRNGDPIPVAASVDEWEVYNNKMKGCAAYVNFDKSSPYGIVYNGFAITDGRGFAPEGYHVPSDDEWNAIWKSLGDSKTALRPMQSKEYWEKPGTNSSGFNAIPAGYLSSEWDGVGKLTQFWSSTPTNPEIDQIYLYHFDIYDHSVTTWYDHSLYGMSVRLIKD